MGSPTDRSSTDNFSTDSADVVGETTATERAVLGMAAASDVLSFFSGYVRGRLGRAISRVRFRAGRIDAVWGVDLDDGRAVVIKCHRRPSDLDAIAAACDAKRVLRAVDFPCAEQLSGPDVVDGRVLTLETLLPRGAAPDGRDPSNRRLLAEGLAGHIDVLRGRPDLISRAGSGPSWCHYFVGPWPVPHDAIVDFTSTPDDYQWLDTHARRAADQIRTHRAGAEVVVGHADWYAGNAAVADGALVATFDWELVADTEAVIAGFTAACFAASSTSGGGLSTPEEASAFLQDYETVRGVPLTGDEQRAAAGSVAWILAFNARWELALRDVLPDHASGDGGALALTQERQHDYLSLSW